MAQPLRQLPSVRRFTPSTLISERSNPMTVGRVSIFSHSRAGKAQGRGMPRYQSGGSVDRSDRNDYHMHPADRKAREDRYYKAVKEGNRRYEDRTNTDKDYDYALHGEQIAKDRIKDAIEPRMTDEPEGAGAPAPHELATLTDRRNPRVSPPIGYKKGGSVRHDDAAMDRKMINAAMKSDEVSDKRMVKSAVRQHETQEHGGKHSKIALACGGKVKRYATGGAVKPPVKRGRSVPVAPPVPPMGPLQSAMSDNYGNNMKRRTPRA